VQTYMIVEQEDGAGCNVELTDAIGVHHTILGFETEAEAQVWIEQDQRGSSGAAQVTPINEPHITVRRCRISAYLRRSNEPVRSTNPMR
jgi:hypothetical protein